MVRSCWSLVVIGFVMVMNAYERPRTGIAMGIPIPVLILIGVVVVMSVIARKHRFGRHVFAMGGSPESAELAGIDTRRLTVLVFALMGLLCGLASIVITARLNAGASVTGTMTELNVIAAAVIGGTSLAGGIGTIYGGLIGALIMQSLESGMILMGVPTPTAEDGARARADPRGLDRHDLPPEAAADERRAAGRVPATSPRRSAACTPSRM